jgi:hypothetical protein
MREIETVDACLVDPVLELVDNRSGRANAMNTLLAKQRVHIPITTRNPENDLSSVRERTFKPMQLLEARLFLLCL